MRKIGLNKWADKLEARTNAEALQMLRKSELYIRRGITPAHQYRKLSIRSL